MADRARQLSGKSFLIVDDEPLLAHDLADHVRSLGASVIGPCHSLTDALDCLNGNGSLPDCALLDIQVGEDMIWPLADRLRAGGAPFILISAHCGTNTVEERFRNEPCLTKPVEHSRLALQMPQSLERS